MRKWTASVGSLGVAALAASIALGCSAEKGSGGQGDVGANLPLVTPPVRAATPAGLGGSGTGSTHTNDHVARLHLSNGPAGVGALPDGAPSPSDPDASQDDGSLVQAPTPRPDGGIAGGGGMCPGSGGVCPDGGAGPAPTIDGAVSSAGGMCPGSSGICPEGGVSPGGDPGAGTDGGTNPDGRAGLDPSDIRSRFFSAGPTDIFSILSEIDSRISEINQRSRDGNVACLSQPPMPYTLTPFGQSVPFYAQCVSNVSTPAPSRVAFFQFGQKDGVTYFYETVGAEAIGARLTPLAAGSGQYAVEAWIGVGYSNASCGNGSGFDDCSYGVMALEADPSRMHFELTIAGIGFGYCGAQLKSDGMVVYAQGSPDMGVTCAQSASVCVSASDVTMMAMCTSKSFHLPAIGRAATSGPNGSWGASQNGSNGVVLDGTASDSLAFGPSTPTPGVAEFLATRIGSEGGGPPPDAGIGTPPPAGDR